MSENRPTLRRGLPLLGVCGSLLLAARCLGAALLALPVTNQLGNQEIRKPFPTLLSSKLNQASAAIISNSAPKSFLALPQVPSSVTAIPPVGSRGKTKLAWDASPDMSARGYRVYWGPASGHYTNSIDATSNLTATVAGLIEGSTYYFAATAYDADGVESVFSNEATNTPPFLVTMRPAADYIEGYGRAGVTNIIEVSTNLTTWTVLKTFRGTGQLANAIHWRSNPAAFFRIRTK